MDVLVSGYAVLRHYGHDFLNFLEMTGGGASDRSTSFMGNAIFAAEVMLMAIPVTAAAVEVALVNLPERNRAAPSHLSQWLPHIGVVTVGSLALAVQSLGLIFTLSRGPWIGTIFAVALMTVLVTIFVGRSGIARLALIIGVSGVITIGVLANPIFKSVVDQVPTNLRARLLPWQTSPFHTPLSKVQLIGRPRSMTLSRKLRLIPIRPGHLGRFPLP